MTGRAPGSSKTRDPFSEERVAKVDKMRVWETYETWPDLALEGLKSGLRVKGPGRRVAVLGMGGSAAAGDILASWLWTRHRVDVVVCKGAVPATSMEGTLAIACSASGETEETIGMMKTALKRGATVVSTSCGGRLASISKELRVPHMQMPEILAPRYMLPFMVFSCLATIDSALGLKSAGEAQDAIAAMRRAVERVGSGVPLPENPAKKLARRLMDGVPSVYGTRATRGAGIRFKNEVNENSKKHASYDEMPELFHNEVQSWEDEDPDFIPVILRDHAEEEREAALADSFTRLLASVGKDPVTVRGEGESGLARLMVMVYELDMASYFMAIGLGRDPFPTPLIARLKKR